MIPKPGYENALEAPLRSILKLREHIIGAKLDDELFTLLQTPENRDALKVLLIKTYFSEAKQSLLLQQSQINLDAYRYSVQLIEETRKGNKVISTNIDEPVRNQGFRRAIVEAYEHRCAFCGVRVITPHNHTAIEAAHIIPWSETHNDEVGNGLALCKLCHWTFDAGLVGISSKYKIEISKYLDDGENIAGHLGTFNKRDLIIPEDEKLHPQVEYIEWHHKNIFNQF